MNHGGSEQKGGGPSMSSMGGPGGGMGSQYFKDKECFNHYLTSTRWLDRLDYAILHHTASFEYICWCTAYYALHEERIGLAVGSQNAWGEESQHLVWPI